MSFTVNTVEADSYFCQDCFNYADKWENHYFPNSGNYDYWETAYQFCRTHSTPCGENIGPVVLDTQA